MFNPSSLIRAHIQEMPPYEPVLPFEVLSDQIGLPPDQIIKLDANENPYGTLPEVKAVLGALDYAHIYPGPQSRELLQALAETHQVPYENLIAGAGADEIIDLVMRALIEPGDALINCPPTFGMYAFDGDINRAQVISIPRRKDFSLEIEAIEEAVAEQQPKLIFLASPNNPDGSLLPDDILERLLALPLIVVLDEAYIEFAPPRSSRIQRVTEHDNLIIIRTFSKWAGLAGLRVGFGAFPSWLTAHLWKIKQPYNVTVASAQAALASLRYRQQLGDLGERIISERMRLYQELEGIPWLETYPSQANFILCKVSGKNAKDLKARLAKAGILVRYFDKPGLNDHIRISVGKPDDTQTLIQKLREME